MDVADIHLLDANIGGWVLFIEGVRLAFASIPALVGSGASSWIGTAHGDREVLLGLEMPSRVGLGETDPWAGKLVDASPVTFGLKDFDGEVVELFREREPDATTDSLGERISPLDDPAPATVPGPNQTPVGLWGRYTGLEAFGPAGERRYYWLAPSDAPPGLDHVGGVGWPPAVITDSPTVWPGRKVALYRIVFDESTGTWPSWQDQYDGGSLWWQGTIKGRGTFRSTGSRRMLSLPCLGPASWLKGSANLLRPTPWLGPQGGVVVEGDRALIAAWIQLEPGQQVGDGITEVPTVWKSQTFASGNTFAGLTTREEFAAYLNDVVQCMITDVDQGTVLAATNSSWTAAEPVASGNWGATDGRKVTISADGSTISIQGESPTTPNPDRGYILGISIDVTVWELFGWSTEQLNIIKVDSLPVGGQNWGEAQGVQNTPTYHRTGLFWTFNPNPRPSPPLLVNGGVPYVWTAAYQTGVVVLNENGGDVLRLGVGEVRCEGQLAQAYVIGDEIDGTPVDAAGWWLFRGERLTSQQFLAGEDPEFDIQVAFCEWVATGTRDAVEIDGKGYASIRVIRWEDPRRFGLPYDRLEEAWASTIGGIQCSPMGIIGGSSQSLDWRHRLIPRTGDVEVADLALGIPEVFVDWASWWTTAAALPGGTAGATNRATYPIRGSTRIEHVLVDAMRGRGLAWSLKRKAGGVVPAYGCFDPIATLTLADVEVTLTREDQAEPEITDDDQWRGVVKLREKGPFDRFVYRVDGDPTEPGSLNYERTQESNDPGRRYRDGSIDWPVDDRGMRDPTPWLGTAAADIYDWTEGARARFANGIGPRYARSTRVYGATYNGTFAGRIGPGSIVHVIDSTAESPDGTRGVNHLGWVSFAEILTRGAGNTSVRVEVELQPRPADEIKVWAPMAKGDVGSWDQGAGVLTVREDWAGVAGGHEDTTGFTQPPWSTLGAGALRVVVYQSETGRTFPAGLVVRADVASADDVAHTLTLANLTGTIYRDTIKIVVAAPKDEQTAPWALALYIPVTEPSGLWDGVENGDRL
jgi:hypothetical protein